MDFAFAEASTHSGRSPSDTLSEQDMEPEPEGTLFAAEEGSSCQRQRGGS